jgi:nucleoside-triphosphatase
MSSTPQGKKACLLTGGPGTGKTTIIKEVLRRAGRSAGGFYTEETRQGGIRQGFRIVTLNGQEAPLSHVDIKGPHRVGKYGVDVGSLDRVGVPALKDAVRERDVVVIDEIGKMELLSPSFRDAVEEALESGKRVLGTIMLASEPWADRVKRRPEVWTITVTRLNREEVVDQVLGWLRT